MANKKRNIVIGSVIGAVLAVAAVLFFFWEEQPEGIVIGTSTLPDSLNPILEQNTSGINANELVFDGLVNFEVDPESRKINSWFALAQSIEQDPKTKKTYTVTLRETSWHDGTKVTSEDVVFSYKAYIEPGNQSPKREYILSFIEDMKVIDDKTVEIEFRNPIPPFRVYPVLTFKIIPSTYNGLKLSTNLRSGENERRFAIEPVGSGPFRLTSWEIGKWVGFTANPYYFKRQPGASSLVMRKVIDPVIRLNEFRKGRINLILETSPLDRPKVEKFRGVDINWFLPYSFYKVAINTNSELFSSVEARQALSAGLERSKVVPSVTDREDVVYNYGPFPSNMFSLNMAEYNLSPLENIAPYDVEAAKELAENSGLAGKSTILLYPDSLGEFGQKMAEGIAKQYSELGLNVEAKRTGDQVFKRLVFIEKNYDLALVYCDGFDNLYSDIDSWLKSDGKFNISGVEDEELDELFKVWDGTVVMNDWVDITRVLHNKISSISPAVYLYSIEKDIYSRGLENVTIASDNPFLSAENWSQVGI